MGGNTAKQDCDCFKFRDRLASSNVQTSNPFMGTLKQLLRPAFDVLLIAGIVAITASGAQSPNAARMPARTPLSAPPPPSGPDPAEALTPDLQKFIEILAVVQQSAAEPVSADKMIYEGAIPSMLRRLDPHTQFFEPSQFDQLKQMEASESKGFGSVVSVLPGQVIFLQIFPGTPTSKAGIQAGDELVAVNNYAIGRMEPEQIIQLLTEARQQKITIYVRRQGMANMLNFVLTPELVDSPSIDRAYRVNNDFGYIRIASWDNSTVKQLGEALTKLDAATSKGLVLDLRNNPGGLVKAALDAAAMFLNPGQRILTAKGRTGTVQSADVPAHASPYTVKLAILVNAKTASASEIFSGALQDHDRAVIVGESTYGKGLVQTVAPLSNGAGMALTTAFYYTPSGRSIQKPLRNSALTETFKSGTSLPTYKTDEGRTVTGGGGIVPDLQVAPAPSTRLQTVLDISGAITAFATQYLGAHTPLPESFQVTPELLDELKVFLSQRNIQPSVAEWTGTRNWIRNRVMEEIVTQARGVAAGDQVAASRDEQLQAAIRTFASNTLRASATANK